MFEFKQTKKVANVCLPENHIFHGCQRLYHHIIMLSNEKVNPL